MLADVYIFWEKSLPWQCFLAYERNKNWTRHRTSGRSEASAAKERQRDKRVRFRWFRRCWQTETAPCRYPLPILFRIPNFLSFWASNQLTEDTENWHSPIRYKGSGTRPTQLGIEFIMLWFGQGRYILDYTCVIALEVHTFAIFCFSIDSDGNVLPVL